MSFVLTVVSASLWVSYGIGSGEAPVWASASAGPTMSMPILARCGYLTRMPPTPRSGVTLSPGRS